MKYPDLTEIGKGAMITTRKASDIAWKSKAVYRFLRSPPQPDTLSHEHEKFLEVGLSPQKRNLNLQKFEWKCSNYKCRWHTVQNNQACQQGAHWSFL